MKQVHPIGWPVNTINCSLRRGGSGIVRVSLPVSLPNGDPLPSYVGWTARIAFVRESETTPVLSMTPIVTPDALAQRFIVDIDFNTARSSTLQGPKLRGDLVMVDPDSELHYALEIVLYVERNWTPLP